MQWILSGEGMGGSCDALLMPADISEQTESIRAKGSIANGGIWTAEHISPFSWLQQLSLYSSSFPCGIRYI
jgi:hypothetical protein